MKENTKTAKALVAPIYTVALSEADSSCSSLNMEVENSVTAL